MNLGIPGDGVESDNFATIPDVSIDAIASRVTPQQVASGNTRGAVVTAGSDGNPQVLQGSQQKFGNGFYVAKPGKNVVTETDPSNFIFNSSQNVFKIAQTGSATIPANAGTSTTNVTVTHSLGFVPAVIAYILSSTGTALPLPYISPTHQLLASGENIVVMSSVIDIASVTSTTITFENIVYNATPYNALPVKYYLLQETAT